VFYAGAARAALADLRGEPGPAAAPDVRRGDASLDTLLWRL
jgi:hypothetical protein